MNSGGTIYQLPGGTIPGYVHHLLSIWHLYYFCNLFCSTFYLSVWALCFFLLVSCIKGGGPHSVHGFPVPCRVIVGVFPDAATNPAVVP